MKSFRYQWASRGDVNAFFGLMLDNIADLLLTVGMLSAFFQFPATFALKHMVPGTAIGVLVGDLLFFVMAFRLAARTRRQVTAMPLGLDTPSTIGMVLFVLGPAFKYAQGLPGATDESAAVYAWHIGICCIVISGLFKFACAFGAEWVRKVVPRAGLLGSLAAVALVLISFLPSLEIFQQPIVGFLALAFILTTLVARVPLPFRIPGALGALLIAGGLFHLMNSAGWISHSAEMAIEPADGLWPYEWLGVFRFDWLYRIPDSMQYMPFVIPFALATVIGGIDCTESAAAVGDEYNTNKVIGVEALATLVAGLCGGVIQTTPYIGHPAYKAMGGKAAYTLATALFVGAAGVLGFFGYLYVLIPKGAVFPILVFIGLEITSQSFQATKKSHYPAIVLACIPALASLALIYIDKITGSISQEARDALLAIDPLRMEFQTVRTLANGFIITSLIWASMLAAMIDRKLHIAAIYAAIGSLLCTVGIIHSPLPGGALFNPFTLAPDVWKTPIQYAIAYLLVALGLLVWAWWRRNEPPESEDVEEIASAS